MGGNGGHNSSWEPVAQYAAELRILLVYLSESLGRLGHWGPHFSWGAARGPLPPVESPWLAGGHNVVTKASNNSFSVML